MKLQPREQSIIGVAAIAAVLIFGWFYGIDPQLKQFKEVKGQLDTANTQVENNEATLASLSQQKQGLIGTHAEMPEGKDIGTIDFESGETLETAKRDLIDSVIEMSQSNHGNRLVHARPLPKPAPVPTRVDPTQTDPNAPPQMQLSDFVEEIPYEIAIRGNYVSINEFVNELSRNDVVVEISQMEVKPEREGQSFADPTKPIKSTFKINFFIKKS